MRTCYYLKALSVSKISEELTVLHIESEAKVSKVKLKRIIRKLPLKPVKDEIKTPETFEAIARPVRLRRRIRVKKISAVLSFPKVHVRIHKIELPSTGIITDLSVLGIRSNGFIGAYECAGLLDICYGMKCEDAAGFLVCKDLSGYGVVVADGVSSSFGIVSHGIVKALQAFVYKYSRLPDVDELRTIGKIGAKSIVERPDLDRSPLLDSRILRDKIKTSGREIGRSTLAAVYFDARKEEIQFISVADSPFLIINYSDRGSLDISHGVSLVEYPSKSARGSGILSWIGGDSQISPLMYYQGSVRKLPTGITYAMVASDGANISRKHVFEPFKGNPLLQLLGKNPREIVLNLAPVLYSSISDDISLGVIRLEGSVDKRCIKEILNDLASTNAFNYMVPKIRNFLAR